MGNRLAADIGGTFTDLVLLDEVGNLHVHKTPSTPDDFKVGVLTGVEGIIGNGGADGSQGGDGPLADTDYFVHGATVVLNALIQRKLPVTALVTTEDSATCSRSCGPTIRTCTTCSTSSPRP